MLAILVGRGLIGLLFGARIAALPSTSWSRMFDLLADYLVVDGVLALIVAALLLREAAHAAASREQTLGLVLLTDGVGRTASGIAVHVAPGIPGFPVTAVMFIGIMAVCTAAVGFTEATLVVEEEAARHGRRHRRRQIPAGPVGIASILAIAFGAAAFLSLDNPAVFQPMLAAYIAAAGAVMLALAWSRRRRVTRGVG